MRKISGLFGGLLLILSAISCGGGDATSPGGGGGGGGGGGNCAANTFCMGIQTFFPTTLTVQVGTPVTWTNGSSQTHDVIFTAAPVADIPPHTQGSNVRTFNVAGSYDFHCDFHPGMVGTLTVTP